LITESDRLGYLITDTSDAMVEMPAQSVAGLRAKIQLTISLYPTDPDWLEAAEYQDWFAMAALRDADRLLAIRGRLWRARVSIGKARSGGAPAPVHRIAA
jgi:hypothetical protein